MTSNEKIEKLEKAGLKAIDKGRGIIFVMDGSAYLGHLKSEDDGTTGTCQNIRRRAGYVAEILRS